MNCSACSDGAMQKKGRGRKMKVCYTTTYRDDKVYLIRETEATFCCDEMNEGWDKDVGFGGYGESRDVVLRSYRGGGDWDEVPIYYCPWCGGKIETEEVEQIHQVQITKRRMVTDSEWKTVPKEA